MKTSIYTADWYQAMTLSERMHTFHPAVAADYRGEKAMQRLQLWKEQSALRKDAETSFTERLKTDGLTEDNLLTLLDESGEQLQQRFSDGTMPAWMQVLIDAFEDDNQIDTHVDNGGASQSKHALLRPIEPLLRYGRMRLAQGIQKLADQSPSLPFAKDTITDLLFPALLIRLKAKVTSTIILEMHVARLHERLHGDTPEARFADFLRHLSYNHNILLLFDEYPVLARQAVTTIDLWVKASLELLQQLCQDWDEIVALFVPEDHPGIITAIKGDKGDLHRNGHSVMQLTFSSGFQLIYKPKSLDIDIHFQELLAWLNAQGQTPPLQTVKILNKGSYGWSEYVRPADCATVEATERFYERQGSYLALLYVLEATDVHAENVIACGEHPFLIDLEALFHAVPCSEKYTFSEQQLQQTINQSVLRIGLLPQRIRTEDNAAGIDLSGLGGQQGQLSLYPVAVWKEAGTDQMRLTREHVSALNGDNQPKFQGNNVRLSDYIDHLTTGFTTTYRLLMLHRKELLEQQLPRFTHDQTRVILRATDFYGKLLTDSFHPNLLRDALDYERIFDRLWLHTEKQTYLKRTILAERADLLNGDTPIFTSSPDSCHIFDSRGEQIADFCAEAAMETVKKRIQQLDEHDLSRQLWIIRATCATTLKKDKAFPPRTLALKATKTQATRLRLLEAASALGDRLDELALNNTCGLNWLSIVPIGNHEWDLVLADGRLYNGAPGIILFLSYLGALTGKKRYTALAKATIPTLKGLAELLQTEQNSTEQGIGIGAFDGFAGLIYLYAHLGQLWDDPSFFLKAQKIVEYIKPLVRKDTHFDIIAGTAGCILSLLSLYTVEPLAQTLAVACDCGKHLLKHAIPMQRGVGWITQTDTPALSGFSHGAAGIAFSLLKLAEVSGETAFHRTALAGMEYERSIFSPQTQNWPDLRSTISTRHVHENITSMTAWCHGSPGIGLGRLGSLSSIDDIAIREEIDRALKNTLANGFGWNHSLCHGDLGNLETLLLATQTASGTINAQDVESLTAMLLHSIESDGWVTNTPFNLNTPGLMTGLAGIGYELLRLAEPTRVPSILQLAPPQNNHFSAHSK